MSKTFKFILDSIIFILLIFLGKLLDFRLSVNFICLFIEILTIIWLLFYFKKHKMKLQNKFVSPYLYFLIIPFVVSLILNVTMIKIDFNWLFVFNILSIFIASVVSELFFRRFAIYFHNQIKYKKVILFNIMYALLFIPSLFFVDIISGIMNIFLAFSLGMFLTGLYLKTKNIWVSILGNFIFSLITFIFTTFQTISVPDLRYAIIYFISLITLFTFGDYLIRDYFYEK